MATPVQVTKYVPPRAAPEWLAAGGILALYAAGLTSGYVTPDSTFWAVLKEYVPGGPERYLWIIRRAFAVIASSHAFEVLLFDQLRMRKHGVPRWSAVWWKWEATVFVEGIGAWKRFADFVSRQQLAKGK